MKLVNSSSRLKNTIACFFFYLRDNVSLHNAVSLIVILTEFIQLHARNEPLLLYPFVRLSVSVKKTLEIHTAVGLRDSQCDGCLSDMKSLKHFFYGDTSVGGSLVRRVTHSEFLLLTRFQLDGPWRMSFEYSIYAVTNRKRWKNTCRGGFTSSTVLILVQLNLYIINYLRKVNIVIFYSLWVLIEHVKQYTLYLFLLLIII